MTEPLPISVISSCFPFLSSCPSASSFPLENILDLWTLGLLYLHVHSAWKALPSHGQLLVTCILAQTSLSQRPCLTALSESTIDTPWGLELITTVGISSQLLVMSVTWNQPRWEYLHQRNWLTLQMMVPPPENQWLNFSQHTNAYFYPPVSVQHMAFLIFFVAPIPLKSYFLCVICLLTLSFRYNQKRTKTFSKLLVVISLTLRPVYENFKNPFWKNELIPQAFFTLCAPMVFKILNFLTEVFHD